MTRLLATGSDRDRICLACREKSCCSYYTVTVTARDLVRVARAMQLAPTDFVTACTVPDGGPGTFLLRPDGPRHALTLVKRAFPDPADSPCIFLLSTNDRRGLCGLGDLRPGQCRTFPSYLTDDFISIVNDPPGCVRTWSYGDVDLDEERRRIVHAKAEEAEHHEALAEWNRRVGDEGRERSFEELCTFLVNWTMGHEGNGTGASGPCSSCRKRCCTSYTVSITGYDAWVIGKGLHLPLESFLVYFPVTEQNDRGFLLEPGGTRYEIALDKVGRYQKGNPCVFWVELASGGGRCGIYSCRPRVCQTYPAYQLEEMVVLRDDVLCPEGAWNLVGMDLVQFRQRLSQFRMEQDLYAYAVSEWNRLVERGGVPRSIRDYYTYVMNLYDRIDRFLGTLEVGALAEAVQQWGEAHPSRPNPLVADLSTPPAHKPRQVVVQELRTIVHTLVSNRSNEMASRVCSAAP
jgi:Fe-S-cluster containining protein